MAETKQADLTMLQKVYDAIGAKVPEGGIAAVTIVFTEDHKIKLIETRYVTENAA